MCHVVMIPNWYNLDFVMGDIIVYDSRELGDKEMHFSCSIVLNHYLFI